MAPLFIAQTPKLASMRVLLLAAFTFLAFSLSPLQPQSPPRPKPQQSAAPPKVWTNDNLAALKGGVSVIGKGASTSKAGRSNLSYGEHSDDIRITGLSDGTIVHPGETISIEVEIASGVKLLSGIGIISPMGFESQLKASPPYTFTVQIPASFVPGSSGPLIGQQPIYAVGAASGRQLLESAPVTVDVERPDLPVSLAPQFVTLYFKSIGDSLPLIMLATFADHSVFEVTDSTHVSFTSSNIAVATVDAYGVVTAAGPGTASIVVTYSLGGKSIETRIPVPFEHPLKPGHNR